MKGPAGLGPNWWDNASNAEPEFSFIPEESAIRCDVLVRTYHAAPALLASR